MTDKDIKDYCKNCDVEPPAMRFKCPECEHNPDKEIFAKDINVPRKEQIIIDKVDVSKCFWLWVNTDKDYKSRCIKNKDVYSQCTYCKDHPNCYFKQLARKTQECEKFKEQLMQKDEVNTFFNTPIEGWSDDPCEICPCKNELQLAEQLIAGVLKALNLEAYDWRADQNEIITEIKAFKQECEELKEKYKEYVNFHNYNDAEFKQERDSLTQEILYKNCYRKALEEIEEIADVLITETNEYESCYYKDSCGDNCYPRIAKVSEHSLGRQTYCQYEAVAKILDIIADLRTDDTK